MPNDSLCLVTLRWHHQTACKSLLQVLTSKRKGMSSDQAEKKMQFWYVYFVLALLRQCMLLEIFVQIAEITTSRKQKNFLILSVRTLGAIMSRAFSNTSWALLYVFTTGGWGRADSSTSGTSSRWNLGCQRVILSSSTDKDGFKLWRKSCKQRALNND